MLDFYMLIILSIKIYVDTTPGYQRILAASWCVFLPADFLTPLNITSNLVLKWQMYSIIKIINVLIC